MIGTGIRFSLVLLVLSCSLLGAPPRPPQPKAAKLELLIKPEQLAVLVLDKHADFFLSNGSYVRGRVLKGDSKELVLRVERTFPKGSVVGPQGVLRIHDVTMAQIDKKRPSAAKRILGAVVGFYVGLLIGVPVAFSGPEEFLPVFAFGGSALGSWLAGKSSNWVSLRLDHSGCAQVRDCDRNSDQSVF